MKRRNKKILLGVSILGMITIGLILLNIFDVSQPMLTLKEDVVTVEYGEVVSTSINDYVNINESRRKKEGPPLLKTKMELPLKFSDNKLYPEIGEYEGKITYEDEILHFKIIVKDTQAPKIVSYVDKIETYETEIPKYQEMFDSKDIQASTLTFDDSHINYEKAGNYDLLVVATDVSGNKNEEKYNVTVKDTEFNLRLHSLYVLVSAKTKFQPEIKGKVENVVYSSSNEEIAEVDNNGQIVTKKPGEVVITAKMGDKTDECKVTVGNNPNL